MENSKDVIQEALIYSNAIQDTLTDEQVEQCMLGQTLFVDKLFLYRTTRKRNRAIVQKQMIRQGNRDNPFSRREVSLFKFKGAGTV